MSRQTKSIAAAVIDSLEFAREARSLEGRVAVAELKRLADVVVEPVGELRCSLRGMQRQDGKAGLELEVSGTLRLRCERCLQAMDFPLEVVARLLPIAAGEPWPDEEDEDWAAGPDEEWDAIEASREQSVPELVEDEVLLALPIVPRHEACEPPVAMEDEHEPSPFAVLAKLKQ
jgi:uncharacterized protein